MKLTYPDYHNCIANLACSILHYYGVTPPNPTLPQADKLLCRPYKNVVLLLLDGMGVSSMKQHLSEHGFFRRNLKSVYSSTFLPAYNRSRYHRRKQRFISEPVGMARLVGLL